MPSNLILTAVASMIYGIAQAHMIMESPTPFMNGTITKDPIDDLGDNFPCKFDGTYGRDNTTPPTVMAIGVNQTLSWRSDNTAIHGGGSCQISLTADANPTKNTTWMVIHSIIGGCPLNAPGNLEAGETLRTFQYSIPEGILPGDYVLAWTWTNRVGNREMYMNCAPVTVTGGDKRKCYQGPRSAKTLAQRATFPNLFVANRPVGGPCQIPEDKDVILPNPGNSVEYAGDKANLIAAPSDCPPNGGFHQIAMNSSSNGTTGGGSSPAAGSSAPAPATSPDATAPPSPGSSPCSSPGAEVCSADGTMIGTCDQTQHVIMGPVAAGTKCVNGAIDATSRKRDLLGTKNTPTRKASELHLSHKLARFWGDQEYDDMTDDASSSGKKSKRAVNDGASGQRPPAKPQPAPAEATIRPITANNLNENGTLVNPAPFNLWTYAPAGTTQCTLDGSLVGLCHKANSTIFWAPATEFPTWHCAKGEWEAVPAGPTYPVAGEVTKTYPDGHYDSNVVSATMEFWDLAGQTI